MGLGDGETDGVGESLSKGTGGDLDTCDMQRNADTSA